MALGFEKGFLNAADFYPGCTPIELGLGWIVAFDKPSFVGRDAVLRRRDEGPRTRLVGLEVPPGAPPPRKDQPIVEAGAAVGRVTNAMFCPTLERWAARGWLPVGLSGPGTRVAIGEGEGACEARVAPSYRWYDPAGARTR